PMSPRISAVPSEPAHQRPPSQVASAKPLLASEVLREESAPLEPGRGAMRGWLLFVAFLLTALGFAFRRGLGIPGLEGESALLSFAAAAAMAATAVLPFPYVVRASLALLLSASMMMLGVRGAGPLAGLEIDGGLLRDGARLLAATGLAAALMFRAHYTEYRRSRVLLLCGFALALPFLACEVAFVVNTGDGLMGRAWAALNSLVLLSSLLGLTGPAGGAGSNVLSGLVLLILPGEIAIRAWTALSGPDSGPLTYPLTAVAFLAATLPASLGLCQLLAAFFGPEARRQAPLPGSDRESRA
ncbi:MAG TPA: hypothetical protein VGP93_10970, partial [Polyangiaceae bacterium]|nr:hypothetical protein [Polyangiaceae bacterium]